MNPRSESLAVTILSGVVTAALLALTAWIYSTGNRVTALEAKVPPIEENVRVIRDQVSDIHGWLMDKP
jgi:cbb3-type cytochrome oxidase subunit 3